MHSCIQKLPFCPSHLLISSTLGIWFTPKVPKERTKVSLKGISPSSALTLQELKPAEHLLGAITLTLKGQIRCTISLEPACLSYGCLNCKTDIVMVFLQLTIVSASQLHAFNLLPSSLLIFSLVKIKPMGFLSGSRDFYVCC